MFNEPMNSRRMFFGLVSVVAVVAILYFGREILVPLAIAILLTFLLSPVCDWLERRGVWRIAAVLITISFLSAVFAVVGWIVGLQMVDLASRLPTYKGNLIAKLQSIRPASGGTLAKLRLTVDEVRGAMDGEETPKTKSPATDAKPTTDLQPPGVATDAPLSRSLSKTDPSHPDGADVEEGIERIAQQSEVVTPVRIVPDDAVPFETLRTVLGTVMAPFASMAIIFVLVIFMLLSREDLRNRMVRLAGNRLALTTRTLDEVGQRISRYLLMNGLVNGGFGLCVAIGLKVIGVEYALTWGLLAAVLRFLPYIGPILAAGLPIGMAFIQFPANDWLHPLATLGLFIVLELICNNIVEPLAYGHGTGVSTVAILVSALFWSWVWGPIGLMLSVPITVVLAVLGNHVPIFEPLGILLSDRPALSNWITYYQRLLAGDVDEAESIVAEQRKLLPLDAVYDELLVQALVLTEKDFDAGELSEEQRTFILNATSEIVDDLQEAAASGEIKLSQSAEKESPAKEAPAECEEEPGGETLRIDAPHTSPPHEGISILACCAKDESDEICLKMLQQLLAGKFENFDIVSADALISDVVGRIENANPDLVIISSLAPTGGAETRYLCKKLRKLFPKVKIVVGRWGCRSDKRDTAQRLKTCGADAIAITLAEGRDVVLKTAEAIDAEALPEKCEEPANV